VNVAAPLDACLAGGGDAGALLRSIDWQQHPLGPVAAWPVTLRTTVGIMLSSSFAMRVLWGPDLVMLHNDAYRPVLGASKYPGAMGRPTEESFGELWHVVGPLFARVMTGETIALEDRLLPLDRHGYLEECFFTLSYSPLSDDRGATGGVLGIVHETTERVLAERRLLLLRQLAAAVSAARAPDEACTVAAECVARAGEDVPFALFYLRSADGQSARLVARAGLDDHPEARPAVIVLGTEQARSWPLSTARIVRDLHERFGELHAGPFPERITNAVILPLARSGAAAPYGYVVAGVSPRRALDVEYEAFFELAAEHVAAAIGNAVAFASVEANRKFLGAVVAQLPAGIVIAEAPSGRLLLANELASALLDRDPATIVAPDHPLGRALSGELVLEEELPVVRRDGQVRTLLISAAPVYDDLHQRVAGVASLIDISDRKGVEAERLALLARAEAARGDAESASRAKDEFLAIVSHELRNPLNAMLGWTRMLRGGALAEDRARAALETIERNAVHQAQLIEDLLDVSRVISGKLALDVKTVTFGRVIEAAIDSARPAIEAKGLRLSVVLDSDAVLAGDAGRLQQVVWNLLTNATKFTSRGGTIRVVLRRDGSQLELDVTDTGQGIDASFLAHVFDRFKQADPSTTRQHGGLGLGLAIAKNLIEMHGGTIEARSAGLGQGASFLVRVPIAATHRADGAEQPVRAVEPQEAFECPPELEGLRILVVDDERDAREMVAAVLTHCGAGVVTAATASVALETLERDRPDVLLSDIGMPEEDGYSLMRRIRALPRSRGGATPAACLTGYTTTEDRRRALGAGFNMHLAKPVEPSELIAVVANLGRMARALRDPP
jgi:signal transduction histidine kinase/ActR/RegA family two-component response regulator